MLAVTVARVSPFSSLVVVVKLWKAQQFQHTEREREKKKEKEKKEKTKKKKNGVST